MGRGRMIVLEGPDGSGKTTQIELLEKHLQKSGYEVVRVREPGGTGISEKIREIILDNDNCKMSYMCEALLYAASRAQLVNEVIKPALEKGKIVICDRFVYSSMVYQGIGRGLGMERIKSINEVALDGLKPDLTFMIAIPYEEGLNRKKKQGNLDRLENSGNEFHKKVFEGYMDICIKYDKIEVLDGNRSVEEIQKDIINTIKIIKL
ncbi:dTMP kinase [Clostridium estertheticum]|uniref:Thymidylate kinase n=2 Tax=Clostridium estertheticum TaxID=238834 RepID=A0A1J0GBF5_9CLOT|nr:dTMP kinase [Clostridium estertheticum]APC38674.1 dTMP kinase [Clostridium estertheticum subsp. estertheticum]MBU3074723.1 dTMP kinase [Clostridium estertheticum]MBU3164565.1 dTMP kinase [Clostridium estertheticum]MBU3174247.1 dTMP kinase [Clostridium estertheticum]MBU3185487.1 dTMP kinase [Clostridium estertheticum]